MGKFLFKIALFVVLIVHVSLSATAEQIPPVDEFSPIHKRLPMIQTHTSDTQTEIHALVPVLAKFKIKVQEIKDNELVGEPLLIESTDIRDPQNILLEKIAVFYIDNLKPNTEYHLELLEQSQVSVSTGDTRRFKTFDTNKQDVRFTAASCICDENKFGDVKFPIWQQVKMTIPDFMILLGDTTYIDSFQFVARKDIPELSIWQRYFRSFADNPLTKLYRLFPVLSTWDDHDSVNDANRTSPSLRMSLNVFNALYGGRSLPGFVENGPDGTYKWFSYGQTDIMLFDARTFREPFETNEVAAPPYAHFGKTQRDWFFERAGRSNRPLFLVKGDVWGSELVVGPEPKRKRVIEGYYADHPKDYLEFMNDLQGIPRPYAFISGDIHRAQFVRLGPQQSLPRRNPFVTAEWTTSPLYSFLYVNGTPTTPGWPDVDRYANWTGYNFGLFQVTPSENSMAVQVDIYGDGTKTDNGQPRDWNTLAPPLLTDKILITNGPSAKSEASACVDSLTSKKAPAKRMKKTT